MGDNGDGLRLRCCLRSRQCRSRDSYLRTDWSWCFCNVPPMLSNVDVIVAFARSARSLKGLFQPTQIRATMIKISISNRITFESGRKRGAKAIVNR
jgi:hypothetical protein